METLEKKRIFLQTMSLFPFSDYNVNVSFVSCIDYQVCTNKLTCLLQKFCRKKNLRVIALTLL